MRALLTWTSALLVLLAGCTSSPQANDGADAATDASTLAAPANATKPAPPALPPPLTAECDIVRTNVGTSLGLGLYVDRALAEPGCYFSDLFPGNSSWARSALVEVEWTPAATHTASQMWIESDACQATPINPCDPPRTWSTTSPMALAIEGDGWAAVAGQNALLQVAAEGVSVQQPYRVAVTLFANATVDAGFTALD